MDLSNIPLIVLAGPTGVGKTDLSIDIAKHYDGEIINGDSLQVYRGLDIGTGKILHQEMQGVPHHLLDILEPNAPFDANIFKKLATEKVIDIWQRNKLPIVVGGTGLYLSGLLYDLEFGGNKSSDTQVRLALEERLKDIGDLALWEQLQKKDPIAADKIPYQNSRRTIRALEVIKVTGDLFSNQESQQIKESAFHELLFVLDRSRELLYHRINQRVEMMIDSGLEAEAHQLYTASQDQSWQSIQGIGYKEWWPYFNGDQDLDDVIAQIQQNSRRYAKRQLTWFRNRMKNPNWIDMESINIQDIYQQIDRHLNERK